MHIQLDNVLRQLGSDAKDAFVRCLQQQETGSCRDIRLVSRSFRELIDGSLRCVRICLRRDHRDLCASGTLPPFRRFTRCTDFNIDFDDSLEEDPDLAGSLLASLLLGMTTQTRERITLLTVRQTSFLPATSLSSFLRSLPSLQTVALTHGLTDALPGRQLVFDSLASLARLQELRMPACRALDSLGLLAESSLRRLYIHTDEYDGFEFESSGARLDENMVAGLSRLRCLEHLTVELEDREGRILVPLLQSLPPSVLQLRVLSFGYCRGLLTVDRDPAGRIVRAALNGVLLQRELLPLPDSMLVSALLGSEPGTRLGSLEISTLELSDLSEDAAGQLQALTWRCDRVQVGTLRVRADERHATGRTVQALLSTLQHVGEVTLQSPYDTKSGLRISIGREVPPPPAVPAAVPATGLLGVPSSLTQIAVDLFLSPAALAQSLDRDTAAAAAAAAASAPADVNAADTHLHVETESGDWGASHGRLALIRGPLLSALTWAPGSVEAWAEQLMARTHAVLGRRLGWAANPEARRHITGYMPLSSFGLVLFCCGTPQGFTALTLAAAEARAAVAAAGMAAAASSTEAMLQVLPATLRVVDASASASFAEALNQAAQLVWEGKASFCAAWSVEHRLQLLLMYWRQMHQAMVPGCP